ncbi:hypothetical protein B0H11DRAFT_2214990 [Mycena galericulata]|nr:hypothetical protein B0H11DRAFT_2214990 [Mycena galericulata]
MAMEAVFVQIPSARAHARSLIVPFVDSLTATLATRFTLEWREKALEVNDSEGGIATLRPATVQDSVIESGGIAADSERHYCGTDVSTSLHITKVTLNGTLKLDVAKDFTGVDIDPPSYHEEDPMQSN